MPNSSHIEVVPQISVFLENRPGYLSAMTRALADAGVDLRTLTIAETERFGIARLVADDPDRALAALHGAGMTARQGEIVAVDVPDRPGGLAHLLAVLEGTDVSIEYMYADLRACDGTARMMMRLDPQDKALEILRQTADLY